MSLSFFTGLLQVFLTWLHYTTLLLLPLTTLLWILGKQKAQRLRPHPLQATSPHALPPRRLSFSAALQPSPHHQPQQDAPHTPNSAPNARRVTFSLTPEQQVNEIYKKTVRHAPPSAPFVHRSPHNVPSAPVHELFPSPKAQRSQPGFAQRAPVGRVDGVFRRTRRDLAEPMRPYGAPVYSHDLMRSPGEYARGLRSARQT